MSFVYFGGMVLCAILWIYSVQPGKQRENDKTEDSVQAGNIYSWTVDGFGTDIDCPHAPSTAIQSIESVDDEAGIISSRIFYLEPDGHTYGGNLRRERICDAGLDRKKKLKLADVATPGTTPAK